MKTLFLLLSLLINKHEITFECQEGVVKKDNSNINYWLTSPDNPWEYCEYTLLLEQGNYTFIPIEHNKKRVLFTIDERGEVFIRYIDNNIQFKIIK